MEDPTPMARVILIEDDALVRTLLMRRMLAAGWSVTALRDGRELEQVMAEHPADLLVIGRASCRERV